MRKRILCSVFILLPIFISAKTIKIAVNHAPPFRIIKNNEFTGIYVEIIKKACQNLGYTIHFMDVSYKRALFMIKSGDADMMLGPNMTEERKQYMVFLEQFPLPAENKVFYYLEDKNMITKYADLYGKKIAVLASASYFEPFNQDKNLIKDENTDYLQCLKKVFYKRADVTIIPERQGDFILQKEGITLKKSPYQIPGNISYFVLSKKSPFVKETQKIEEELKKIKIQDFFSPEFIKTLIQKTKE